LTLPLVAYRPIRRRKTRCRQACILACERCELVAVGHIEQNSVTSLFPDDGAVAVDGSAHHVRAELPRETKSTDEGAIGRVEQNGFFASTTGSTNGRGGDDGYGRRLRWTRRMLPIVSRNRFPKDRRGTVDIRHIALCTKRMHVFEQGLRVA
jgi:hypothetical protein